MHIPADDANEDGPTIGADGEQGTSRVALTGIFSSYD